MKDLLQPYNLSVIALSVMALLMLIQQFIAATAKNVVAKGSTPGIMLTSGHDDFSFRAERAHANTVENILPFLIVLVLAVTLKASPKWTNIFALTFLGARSVHMIVYYAGIQPVRTLAFLIGFICNVSIAIMALLAAL